jgi:predicted dehydrogenase
MKALFIGLGSIGQRHLRNLIALNPNIEISAVRGKNSKNLVFSKNNKILKNSNLVTKYKITEFSNLSKALKYHFDIIFITNPSSLHFKIAKQAIASGAYIFIEKPAVDNEKDFFELEALEKSYQGKIFVGYQYRFHPVIKKSSYLIRNNLLGNIVSARFKNGEYLPDWHPYEDYRQSYAACKKLGGGTLLTQIHDLDYSTLLLGAPIELFAVGGKNSSLEVDVEDSIQILMNTKIKNKKIPISISLNYVEKPPERTFEVIGDKGKILCDLNKNTIYWHSHTKKNKKSKFSFPAFKRNDMFLDEMKAFLSFASGNKKIGISLKDSEMSLKIVFLAKKSMKSGKTQKIN